MTVMVSWVHVCVHTKIYALNMCNVLYVSMPRASELARTRRKRFLSSTVVMFYRHGKHQVSKLRAAAPGETGSCQFRDTAGGLHPWVRNHVRYVSV